MFLKSNEEKYEKILDKYLNEEEKIEVDKIIKPFLVHKEFQKRMTKEFLHHSDITLGEHIIEDTVVTYLLCKKRENINLELALKISMMHDLYQVSWQNNTLSSSKKFVNKHGFRHPLEAIVNALIWYPEYFLKDSDARIIIDGVIHHMYPFPVRSIDNFSDLELKNADSLKMINKKHLEMIVESTRRGKIGKFSLAKSRYPEGQVMSKADKKVSFHQIKNFSSAKALITGKNKSIK